LTTVASIKTMLEARIVAVRIHPAASGAHGVAHGVARMTSASDGCIGNCAHRPNSSVANARDFADAGRCELFTSLRYERGVHQEVRALKFIA